MNAKKEFINHVGKRKILCANIAFVDSFDNGEHVSRHNLKINYKKRRL